MSVFIQKSLEKRVNSDEVKGIVLNFSRTDAYYFFSHFSIKIRPKPSVIYGVYCHIFEEAFNQVFIKPFCLTWIFTGFNQLLIVWHLYLINRPYHKNMHGFYLKVYHQGLEVYKRLI